MLAFEKPKFPVVIRRADRGAFTFYSFEDKKKSLSGTITKGKVPCRFKKGVEIEDGTILYIEKAYLDWYKKGFEYKPVVFITEYTSDSSSKKTAEDEALTDYHKELKENYDFEDFEDFEDDEEFDF